MVAGCNLSIQEAEKGRSQVPGQAGLYKGTYLKMASGGLEM